MTDQTKALIVGVGMVADMHANAINATQGRVILHAALGRRPDAVDRFAKKHGVKTSLYTLDEEADLSEIDIAIVTTPSDARREFIAPFAAQGIPLLVEKPVARTLEEARAFVSACEDAQIPLGIVLQHRMRWSARLLMDRIADGRLGEIASLELRVPWWRDQSYYDSPGRGSFARDGGGVLMTQAIHSLDLLLQFCGPVDTVQALTSTTALHTLEAEDFAGAVMRFHSGAVGSVMASVTHFPGGAEEIILNGTKGSAHLASDHLRVFYQNGETEELGKDAATGGGADPMAFSHAWHQAVIEDFAQAVADQRPPAITGRSALAVHALIDAITRSASTGQRTTVEPT